jgi:hypothetical protein
MAIEQSAIWLAPARGKVGSRVRSSLLQVVPDYENFSQARAKKFNFSMVVIATFVFGLLSLLVINTLLTQDAFVLQRLKHQANLVKDQRDAVLQIEEQKSSPDQLAVSATKLGMIPSDNPDFLDLSKVTSAKDFSRAKPQITATQGKHPQVVLR